MLSGGPGRPSLLALAALALALPGCASPPAADAADGAAPEGPAELAAPGAGLAPDAAGLASVLRLSGCSDALTAFSYPPEPLVATAPPPGWAGNAPQELRYQLQACHRVSIDAFERGPRHVLMEVHSNGVPPPGCEGGYTRARILSRVWVDDAEIAAHLRQAYGMPAEVAEFTLEETTVQGSTTSRWTFGLPGGAASTLEAQRWDAPDDASETVDHRFFWEASPGRIAYLDLDGIRHYQANAPLAITGDIKPPLLHGAIGPWVGYGAQGEGLEVVAPIRRFGDLQCATPA